jgi:hypothetical protein
MGYVMKEQTEGSTLTSQVRKAIKSLKSEALRHPINMLACFGRKFERTVFKRTTSSPIW